MQTRTVSHNDATALLISRVFTRHVGTFLLSYDLWDMELQGLWILDQSVLHINIVSPNHNEMELIKKRRKRRKQKIKTGNTQQTHTNTPTHIHTHFELSSYEVNKIKKSFWLTIWRSLSTVYKIHYPGLG